MRASKGYLLILLIPCILILTRCSSINRDPYTDTPTSGKIFIGADETFKQIVEAEIDVFHAIYGYSEIKPLYVPEIELFKMLTEDSVSLIIASRYLNSDEIEILNQKKIFPKQTEIALDAIAVITHKDNPIPYLNLNQLRQIFTGEITNWNEISPKGENQKISIVFDNPKSSILRMIVDSISVGKPLSGNSYAMEFTQDVIGYVSRNSSALGLVGVSWVSDKDDSLQLSFLNKVNVLAIGRDSISTSENTYKPYQAYLAQGLYPLSRNIIMINAEPRTGLATGFTSFVAGDKGQRILLKSGVLPAIAPTRLVKVRDDV